MKTPTMAIILITCVKRALHGIIAIYQIEDWCIMRESSETLLFVGIEESTAARFQCKLNSFRTLPINEFAPVVFLYI